MNCQLQISSHCYQHGFHLCYENAPLAWFACYLVANIENLESKHVCFTMYWCAVDTLVRDKGFVMISL